MRSSGNAAEFRELTQSNAMDQLGIRQGVRRRSHIYAWPENLCSQRRHIDGAFSCLGGDLETAQQEHISCTSAATVAFQRKAVCTIKPGSTLALAVGSIYLFSTRFEDAWEPTIGNLPHPRYHRSYGDHINAAERCQRGPVIMRQCQNVSHVMHTAQGISQEHIGYAPNARELVSVLPKSKSLGCCPVKSQHWAREQSLEGEVPFSDYVWPTKAR